MEETPVFEIQKSLEEIFNETTMKFITQELMKTRSVSPTDEITYSPVEKEQDGVTYVITAEHVPIEVVMKHADRNCRMCNSKGYSVRHMEKSRVPNPQDFILLSDSPIEGMTDEQKKLWMEMEKKKKMWRVMLPCRCALKNLSKKQHPIASNEIGNIVAKITYQVKK